MDASVSDPRLTRNRAPAAHCPVIIIGGGINGAGLFRDLSLQGVDTLLVDSGDFCAGASAGPSRLIHGGIKYLESGEFRRLCLRPGRERIRDVEVVAVQIARRRVGILMFQSWLAEGNQATGAPPVGPAIALSA